MSRTEVNQSLLRTAVEALPDDALAPARRAALEHFSRSGFPTPRHEDWKYTNLADAAELSNEWLELLVAQGDRDQEQTSAREVDAITSAIDAHWIVIRDGVVDAGALEIDGARLTRLAVSGDATDAVPEGLHAFNMALLLDGLRIEVDANRAPGRPIGILYVDSASSAVTQTRLSVEISENASLQLIEHSISADDGRQFTNHVFDAVLGASARLDHVRLQNRQAAHTGVNHIGTTLGADSTFRHNSFDLGGALTRNDVVADIRATGATVELNGLYLASGNQHIDNHTAILHGAGPATSTEEYRGIAGGRARCVFNGKVVVAEGADGTDSSQSNHNLLLSDRAEIDTKPELEIYADEVKCAHGATVGQLDDTALFYLRTRGLDSEQAQQVLTRAFAAVTLGTLAIDACHDPIAGLIDRRLEQLVGE
jgi:Fe-S cluster assembly protein SufD